MANPKNPRSMLRAVKKKLEKWEDGTGVQSTTLDPQQAAALLQSFATGDALILEMNEEPGTGTASTDETKIIIAMAPSKPGNE